MTPYYQYIVGTYRNLETVTQGRTPDYEAIAGAIWRAVKEHGLFLAHTRSMFQKDSAKRQCPRILRIVVSSPETQQEAANVMVLME